MNIQCNPKYKYHLRPGYGAEALLIEIFYGGDNEGFENDFLKAIKDIRPEIVSIDDLWMNDEVQYSISTDLGLFDLIKDIWDLAFLIADDNQPCISKISQLLILDEKFEKVEVDHNNYKLQR